MQIVADENIPYAREAFGTLGEVNLRPGRTITRDDLAQADALVVRSITRVNERLLARTPVRFVGTCTIGEDHVDLAWLRQRGIAFSSAPGCNANSVGEYIVAALLELAGKHQLQLDALSLGIVGLGNVGRNVLGKARALGLHCVVNDPPLAEQTCEPIYRPLEDILQCDIVTFHVPLEKSGPYATWHLVDAAFLARMKPGAILLNTSRGPVVDNQALLQALRTSLLRAAVLDVWEGEPEVDTELLAAVDVATPHIAGYSFDGKVNGTVQVYRALCRHLCRPPAWDPAPLLPSPTVPEIALDPCGVRPLSGAVRQVYDIMKDDAAMRPLGVAPPEQRRALFDQLRKQYPQRREFHNTRVLLTHEDQLLRRKLSGIGFQCEVRNA
ncbi:MAG: 4-phosphoerythronate dehydrogenase PdxB [Candidatus Hydrogenedentes bacterium]|nr:4-phosphoerythronate dehydrogenase PdxB [Candidatus Hydrogenedentota bacterium]